MTSSSAAPEGSEPLSAAELEERLVRQRADLARNVDELAARVDPRTQAREAGAEVAERIGARAEHLRHRAADLGARAQDPSTYESLRGSVRDTARDLSQRARRTLQDAQEGDPESMRALAVTAGAAVAALALGGVISSRNRH